MLEKQSGTKFSEFFGKQILILELFSQLKHEFTLKAKKKKKSYIFLRPELLE
jgi:hypothetical protein